MISFSQLLIHLTDTSEKSKDDDSEFHTAKTDDSSDMERQRVNIAEESLLENQILILAREINQNKILFEFRMLKNFKLLFQKEIKYIETIDNFSVKFQ